MGETNMIIPELKSDYTVKKIESSNDNSKAYILTTPYKKYKINELCYQIISNIDGKRNFQQISENILLECDAKSIQNIYEGQLKEIGIVKGSQYVTYVNNGFLVWKKTLLKADTLKKTPGILLLFKPILVIVLIACNIIFSCYGIVKLNQSHTIMSLSEMMSHPLIMVMPMLVMYVSIFIHELGHCFCCFYFKGEAGDIGIGAYFILPVLYTNLDDIWTLKKYDRICINLSGIYLQNTFLFLVEAGAWLFDNEKLFTFLVYVQIVNFINLIPFIKLDGYWILVDILDYPNLFRDACTRIVTFFHRNKKEHLNFKPKHNTIINFYIIGFMVFMLWFVIYILSCLWDNVYYVFNQIEIGWNSWIDIWHIMKSFVLCVLFYKVVKVVILEVKCTKKN